MPNSKAMIHAECSELEEIKSLERDIVKLESMIEFRHSHPVEDVYEYVRLSLATNNVQKGQRIPFDHLDTERDLIISRETAIVTTTVEASNINIV